MVKRFSPDARKMVVTAAAEEARRRGDRRIGTEHLLLGLLQDPHSLAGRTLGVDLRSAREASVDLDRTALASVGVEIDQVDPVVSVQGRRRPPFTSGARAVLERSVREATATKARGIEARHLLLALLARERPDPAAELLGALGVDSTEARDRLLRSAG